MSMVNAKVEIFSGSTLVRTCTCSDVLSEFAITREGDNAKFFGFGICHNLKMVLIDLDGEVNLQANYTIKVGLGSLADNIWDYPYPTFYITEISRNEKNKTITVKAADKISSLNTYTFADLHLTAPYTLNDIASSVATKYLNSTISLQNIDASAFALSYEKGANLEGTEKLREILNAIAEVTQTIYFINYQGQLVFKRLRKDTSEPDVTADPSNYYELDVSTPRTLTAICSATELGDNLTAGTTGVTQYIRNNPFLDLRADRATLLDNAIAAVGGLTVYQFELDWVGDYRVEIGDLIELVTATQTVYSYNLSDSIKYAGTFSEVHKWSYSETDETASNPTSIRDAIDKTYARVDKMEKEITLYVGEVVDTVVAERIDNAIEESIDGFNDKFNELQDSVDAVNGRIDTVDASMAGLQNVQLQHTDRFAKIELDTQSIYQEVKSLTETTEVLEGDIDEAKLEAFAKAESEAARVLGLAQGYAEDAENFSKAYTDQREQVITQNVEAELATIAVSTDKIKLDLVKTEETLLTKFDDYYTKTEVYSQRETDAKIAIARNAIEIGVADTYETKSSVTQQITATKSYASGQASAAQQAAQGYADTVSGNAEAKAKIYADNAADGAEANAKEYADGVAGDAEANAKAYTDGEITTVVSTVNEQIANITVTTNGIVQRVEDTETRTEEIYSGLDTLESSVETNTSNISKLELDSNNIKASVSSLQESTRNNIDSVNEEVSKLSKRVDATMTSEEVSIIVQSELKNGVDTVTTKTGFTFDEDGLHISKSGSQMESTLDEDGLVVSRYDAPVLTATSEGVNALNISVRQFLKIGGSRFESYKYNRTGCYWIGD